MTTTPSTIDLHPYEPPLCLWKLIEQYVPEHERDEIKNILGESLVEQSLELHQEVNSLVEIMDEYRNETNNGITQTRLPEPPDHRDRLVQEIKFFIDSLQEKANREGHTADNLLSRHNVDVLDYAMENADKVTSPTPRPATGMSQGKCSDRQSEASSISEGIDCINDKLNVLRCDEIVQNLRQTLEGEISQLLEDINFLQNCLEEEVDFRSESRATKKEPTLTELREERASLEKDLLTSSAPMPPTHVDKRKPAALGSSRGVKPMVGSPMKAAHHKTLSKTVKNKSGAQVPVSKPVVAPHAQRPGSAQRFRKMISDNRTGS